MRRLLLKSMVPSCWSMFSETLISVKSWLKNCREAEWYTSLGIVKPKNGVGGPPEVRILDRFNEKSSIRALLPFIVMLRTISNSSIFKIRRTGCGGVGRWCSWFYCTEVFAEEKVNFKIETKIKNKWEFVPRQKIGDLETVYNSLEQELFFVADVAPRWFWLV